MLELIMKNILLHVIITLILLGCTDQHMSPQYEPLFLNETNSNVLFIYGSFSDSTKNLDTLRIAPSDTIYSIPGEKFPWLDEKGLNQGNGSLYDIRIVFEKKPKRCLNFEGTEMKTNDIRNFSSYENICTCYFCSGRSDVTPDAMLYRITKEMFKQAKPCE